MSEQGEILDMLRHPLDPARCTRHAHVFTHVIGPMWDRTTGADVYCCDNCGKDFYLVPCDQKPFRYRWLRKLHLAGTE